MLSCNLKKHIIKNGKIINRMDGADMESNNGLQQSFRRLQILLCRNNVEKTSGDGSGKI